jgi:phosphonate transport system substrate-binding protein
MTYKLLSFAAATLLASTVAFAQPNYKPLEKDPEVINFGIISTESTVQLKKSWTPFLADMEKALGMEVKPFFASDYAGIIEGMRFGKVHVAWFGNKSAMEAVDRAGAEIFVQEIKADGTQGYYSHILAHADNDKINNLKDALKCDQSLDFGIGDPNSTSGFLVPTYYVFAQNNVDPRDCFKTVRNANHETNLMAVANKQVDIAANNSEQLARSKAVAPEAAKSVKVIWTSPLIPADPITYRKDLSKPLKAKIKAFFLGYGRIGELAEAQQKRLFELGTGGGGYTDSNNAQLYPIRQLALFKDKLKIEGNENMSAADKEAKLAEIERKLAELEILAGSSMGVAAN